ncbi:putative uridine kinase [Lachnellula subtilissima]|uniref:Putative uridine kinase n=1 Tax=Lachnellula subtilissima TaxID=602034 RepID=A0A8H8RYC4_9HELO|nr:putative uridine kinase [Lachnellula subtilissima]
MEEQVNRLVERTWAKFQKVPESERLLIAISGIPGSGKTSLATTVTSRLNALHGKETPIAAYIPMDGYHYSRAHLSSMPDPENAHARRGAAFTFDGPAFLALAKNIRQPLSSSSKTLYAPSFDHAKKDPVENEIEIAPSSRIVVFEGNYLSLGKGEWKEAAEVMDELWFVEVDFDTAGKRLVPRHVKAGIAPNEEEAWKRVRENDLVNGLEIVESRLKVDELIISTEDGRWAPKD